MSGEDNSDRRLVGEFQNAVDSLFDFYINTFSSESTHLDSNNLKVSTFMKISISSVDQEVHLTLDGPVVDELTPSIFCSSLSDGTLPQSDESF